MTGDDELALADRVLGALAAGDEAVVSVLRTRSGLTRFANSFVHQHVGDETTAVRLTVCAGGRTASATTTDLRDPDALDGFVARTREHAALLPPDPGWPGVSGPAAPPAVAGADAATVAATPDDRVGVVADFVAAARDLQAAGFVDTGVLSAALVTTGGQRVTGARSRASLDGIHQTATSAGRAHQTSRSLADLDGAAAGREAADLARRAAEPDDLEPGEYEVVLAPECVGEVLSYLAVAGFNAKHVAEGRSFVRLGETQLDPAITLVEDPTDPRAIALPVDAEGTPRQRLELVADGVPTAVVHDRRTARRAGTISTGHAVPDGASLGPVPTSVFLSPGRAPPAELLAGVERGLLVTDFHYCRLVDPKRQVVTGLTRNGTFLIERGEITRPVANLRFTESFAEALGPGRVLGVGDDGRFAGPRFGAGTVHCPSLRLASWRFTGGASG